MATNRDEETLVRRAKLQLVFALISAGLTVLATIVPVWIEETTGLEPDGGNGELEWLIAVAFGVVSIVFGIHCYRTRQQLKLARG